MNQGGRHRVVDVNRRLHQLSGQHIVGAIAIVAPANAAKPLNASLLESSVSVRVLRAVEGGRRQQRFQFAQTAVRRNAITEQHRECCNKNCSRHPMGLWVLEPHKNREGQDYDRDCDHREKLDPNLYLRCFAIPTADHAVPRPSKK
jgi:hypothetical protein